MMAFSKAEGASIDLRAVFDEFDADGSGEIDELEFRMAMISLGVELTDEVAAVAATRLSVAVVSAAHCCSGVCCCSGRCRTAVVVGAAGMV